MNRPTVHNKIQPKLNPNSIRPRTQRETAWLPFLPPAPLRKLLFSATFTADPQKAALLDLRCALSPLEHYLCSLCV